MSNGTWVTIATPNQELDIASGSQNAAVGGFSLTIPAGEYVNFRATCSETMKFSGSAGTHYTKAGGSITVKGDDATDASTATWASDPPATNNVTPVGTHTLILSQQGEVTMVADLKNGGDIDDDMVVYAKTDLSPISVKSDSRVSMFFDFDTQSTVHYESAIDEMYLTPPKEGSQFGVTVDGVSYSVSEANMRTDF
ncbi:MAG: hypothetical protein NT014_00120 [Candidatus Omnitrophica bacterium]|nr:hypothetical protein [Candidatus Omnitrophota bacterium]